MPSENSSERKCVKLTTQKVAAAGGEMPPEPEQLQCPRCDSHNTKFCYYNNYNFSQPRHFCKSCRRYWTKGGTLRDIPIGGGSRKNAKRSRVAPSNNTTTTISSFPFSSNTTTTTTTSSSATSRPITSQFLGPISNERVSPLSFWADAKASGVNLCGSFTSLLNTHGPGFFAVGGLGGGLEDVGFGMGRAVWPFPGVGLGETGGFNGGHWHLQNGETTGINSAANGDCFTLSDVNLSTPRFG